MAAYDATVANYRQTVLTAFQQVEDNLAALRVLENEAQAEDDAVKAAQNSLDISTYQYKAGTVNYLTVITEQAILLQDQVQALNILTRRMSASVLLIEALGGGWNTSKLPTVHELGARQIAPILLPELALVSNSSISFPAVVGKACGGQMQRRPAAAPLDQDFVLGDLDVAHPAKILRDLREKAQVADGLLALWRERWKRLACQTGATPQMPPAALPERALSRIRARAFGHVHSTAQRFSLDSLPKWPPRENRRGGSNSPPAGGEVG